MQQSQRNVEKAEWTRPLETFILSVAVVVRKDEHIKAEPTARHA